MPIHNVVPIDADTARMMARRETRFRWFVAALGVIWLAALIPVLVLTPLPPLAPFLFMAALVIFAEHRFVLFGDETSMSASIVVVVAAVFVFADSAPLAGPMLIGSLGGLYLPHLRYRQFTLLVANSTSFGMAVLCATCLVGGFDWTHERSTSAVVVATGACVATYWYVNSVLIGCASGLRNGTGLRSTIAAQITSEWPASILAIGAGLIAQDPRGAGAAALPVLVALPLLAFEAHISGTQRPAPTSAIPSLRIPLSTALTCVFAIAIGGPFGISILAMGAFVVSSLHRSEARTPSAAIAATGIAGAALLFLAHLGVPVSLQFALGAVLTTASLTYAGVRRESIRLGLRLTALGTVGTLLPTRQDISFVALAACVAQLAINLATIDPAWSFTILVVGVVHMPFVGIHTAHGPHVPPRPTDRRTAAGASR